MVKTNYSGLNPVVVQALNNLHYRYSDETPKMWCSRIHVPFRKLLEYNPKFFSKNEFIHMTEREYKYGKFGPGRPLSSKNEINKLYYNNSYYLNRTFRKNLSGYDKLQAEEIMKEIVVRITNSAKVIQQAWRAFKLRPEIWAK
ncbi:hypothetical protein RhiirA1_474119 [Rhizophagus irregularis]|uniref:Uncharacterized protein n=1 Tax=Rhizophagus irregularis TaxID=588596 RepID=A0A2N0QZ82_9GLOM|nr:hypothetical protein RhiirA1_474119 [Rhizophagus irregularis]